MNAQLPFGQCLAFCAARNKRRSPISAARCRARRGAAVVELAILTPLMVMLFVLACDFARVFHFSLTLTNCARAGALYASDPLVADESAFANTTEAALADAGNLSPAPVIQEHYGTDASGREWVEVSAEYTFNTITGFPGIPSEVKLTRTVRMFIAGPIPGWN